VRRIECSRDIDAVNVRILVFALAKSQSRNRCVELRKFTRLISRRWAGLKSVL